MKREMRIRMAGKPQTLDRSRTASNGMRFDSRKNSDNKAYIRMKAERIAQDEGIVLPIPAGGQGYTIAIFVQMKIPRSYSNKKVKEIQEKGWRPFAKPDLDNHMKLWLDGLKGIIEDDRMVTSLTAHKRYGDEDFSECVIYWEE